MSYDVGEEVLAGLDDILLEVDKPLSHEDVGLLRRMDCDIAPALEAIAESRLVDTSIVINARDDNLLGSY